MYCKDCGRKIEKDSKFCQLCGAEQTNKSHIAHKDSTANNVDDTKSKNPMLTIFGFITFVVVFIFVKWLLGGGIIEGAIAGAVAAGAAWLASSYKVKATKIGKNTKESEDK